MSIKVIELLHINILIFNKAGGLFDIHVNDAIALDLKFNAIVMILKIC